MKRTPNSLLRKAALLSLALLLALSCLAFSAPKTEAATVNHTLAEAQAWMDGKLGSSVNWDGSQSGVQCVDLARMYSSWLGADLGVCRPSDPNNGIAADYLTQNYPTAYYTRLTNSQTTAQAGDIFVNAKGAYGANAKTGHVGLIHHVSGNSFYIIDYGYHRGAPATYTKVDGLRSFSAVLRPNFKNANVTLDVNGLLDGVASGNLGDFGTFSVTVGGTKTANVNDYYNSAVAPGTKYEITDVKAKGCHEFKGVTVGSLSGTLNANAVVQLSFVTKHTPKNVPEVPATCLKAGKAAGQVCSVCGATLSGLTEIPALGHDYKASRVAPTCTADAVDVFTCTRCGDSYKKAAEATAVYGKWQTTRPTPGENQTVESRTEYRYADKKEVWEKSGEGTIDYAASWPAGFLTSSSLYSQYNKAPKTAGETADKKTEVTTSPVGWIYWHWCRNSYAYGPINRTISSQKDGTHVGFHAFFSTTDAAVSVKENARRLDNKAVCADTYWWLVERVEVRRCAWTEYKKAPGDGWGEWSAWSAVKATASDTRKVETRTVYRLKTETPVKALGHAWDGGKITTPATCTATGVKTFACTRCGQTRTETVAKAPHDWDAGVVTRPATADEDGVIVYTCRARGCGAVKSEKIPAGYVRLGDVDFDGSITAADARLALRRAVELENYAPGSKAFIAANVDRDADVTAADARKILRAAVELENPNEW